MKWYFQFTPHDTHDWDAQAWPVLVDLPFGGKTRKLVLHANRNGFFYVLDRTSGEYLRATSWWITWIGRTVSTPKDAPFWSPDKDPTPAGNRVCPGVRGATNWMSPILQPGHGTVLRGDARAMRHLHQLLARTGAQEELLRRRRRAQTR